MTVVRGGGEDRKLGPRDLSSRGKGVPDRKIRRVREWTSNI